MMNKQPPIEELIRCRGYLAMSRRNILVARALGCEAEAKRENADIDAGIAKLTRRIASRLRRQR